MALLIVAATSWPASLFYVGRIVPPRSPRSVATNGSAGEGGDRGGLLESPGYRPTRTTTRSWCLAPRCVRRISVPAIRCDSCSLAQSISVRASTQAKNGGEFIVVTVTLEAPR
jgi:hypothetical protein